ncbi:MAG: hypothetical protein FJ280_07700 [Planctomycetes bacterium]|nr:hypothetical protein [Planctomycetota bacterium]
MLKKIIVVLAVLAMVSPAFGQWKTKFGAWDPNNISFDRTVDWEQDGERSQRKAEAWNWPAEYRFVPMADIKVVMDVGFWIRLQDCGTIKLQQKMVNQYGGQVKCKVYTNVAIEWKGDFIKDPAVNLAGSASIALDPKFMSPSKGAQELGVKLKLDGVDLNNDKLPAGAKCVQVGWVRLSVRPTMNPNTYMAGGCGSSYPQYSPPSPDNDSMVWW